MVDKKRVILGFSLTVFVLVFYNEFIRKGETVLLSELNSANENVRGMKRNVEELQTQLRLQQEEVTRKETAWLNAKNKAADAERLKKSCLTDLDECQEMGKNQERCGHDYTAATEELHRTAKALEDERLVSRDQLDKLEKARQLHQLVQDALTKCQEEERGDGAVSAEQEGKMRETERALKVCLRDSTAARGDAQLEAEKAKELQEDLDKAETGMLTLTRKESKCRAELKQSQDMMSRLTDPDRDAVLETSQKKKLEFWLDPETAPSIQAVTWNIAAINNNPFEYWIAGSEEYNTLMEKVATLVTTPPADFNAPVHTVFTQDMWEDLKAAMVKVNWPGVDKVTKFWETEFKSRKIITGFLQDKLIGKKRLASMPDRVSNTIKTRTGLRMRPTVINCYSGPLDSQKTWWKSWLQFMFREELEIVKGGRSSSKFVYQLLTPIKKAKYPAVTEEEEEISLPLQTLAGAIFDAVLVHMMNVAAPGTWEQLRGEMCDKLNKGKNTRITEILTTTYASASVVFLQEVSPDFETVAKKSATFQSLFELIVPKVDTSRGQTSVILLQKAHFTEVTDVSQSVLHLIEGKAPVSPGDLFVITARNPGGIKFIFASFHGDTNGLATKPIVGAVHRYAAFVEPTAKLVFGMDANTYENPNDDQLGLAEFASYYTSLNMTTCYGDTPDPTLYTTFHARTHLQPQLNKAVSLAERDQKGDKNPKDNIMFFQHEFVSSKTARDNTGDRFFKDNMVFPTLTFPSDHAATSTTLRYPTVADRRRRAEARRKLVEDRSLSFFEATTWNLASFSSNPFAAYASAGEDYDALMEKVTDMIQNPTEAVDVAVKKVFTSDMWDDLQRQMKSAHWEGMAALGRTWADDLSERKIVSEFLKDAKLWKKGFVAAAEEATNTVAAPDGSRGYRPGAVSCYAGDSSTSSKWWVAWRDFMFSSEVETAAGRVKPWRLLKKMTAAGNSELTEDEEILSIPLQTLSLAIYDAIIVYFMNKAGPKTWESVRRALCSSLHEDKTRRTVQVLSQSYLQSSVVFLQNVDGGFEASASKGGQMLSSAFDLVKPGARGAAAYSAVLLKKDAFVNVTEVTRAVEKNLRKNADVPAGDLVAVTAVRAEEALHEHPTRYFFASFLSGKKGLLTIPVVDAIVSFVNDEKIDRVLVGLDAGTHSVPREEVLDQTMFSRHFTLRGLASCYGSRPHPTNYTTIRATTNLQPLAPKALAFADLQAYAERRPSDTILFFPHTFAAVRTAKDNTGERVYKPNLLLPTLSFPSDHSLTTVYLNEKRSRPIFPPGKVREILSTTWNVAAVNNNPFEYWITGPDDYNKLMEDIANVITFPDEVKDDVLVKTVFTPDMFLELKEMMEKLTDWEGIDVVDALWNDDFAKRRIVTEFLKDKKIGKKRLASMPDRYTNTITSPGGAGPYFRPTVINCYEGDLSSMKKWWTQWKHFMFSEDIDLGSKGTTKVFQMLQKIKRSKYPDVTEEEEKVSLPLQTLAAALFDSILVHLMNTALPTRWESLRTEMCDKLNRNKNSAIAQILDTQYYRQDVIFLQEVGTSLLKQKLLGSTFDVHVPAKLAKRDQNSIILLKKHEWRNVRELTEDVLAFLEGDAPVETGDLFVINATRREDEVDVPYLLASFHGDTNGLATKPIVRAVNKYLNGHKRLSLVFGMDANTYEFPAKDQQGLADFAESFTSEGLTSCYGSKPNAKSYTTFHARTHLQTQLNKAVSFAERDAKGDKNPKDHILFKSDEFSTVAVIKDNTGRREYINGMVFPTLDFPSDHGITLARLQRVYKPVPDDVEGVVKVPVETVQRRTIKVISWNAVPLENPFEFEVLGLENHFRNFTADLKKELTSPKTLKEIVPPTLISDLKADFARVNLNIDSLDDRWAEVQQLTIGEYYEKRGRHSGVEATLAQVNGTFRPSMLTCGDWSWENWRSFMFNPVPMTAGNTGVAPYALVPDAGYEKEISILGLAVLDSYYGYLLGQISSQKHLLRNRKRICDQHHKLTRVPYTLMMYMRYAQVLMLQNVPPGITMPRGFTPYEINDGYYILVTTKMKSIGNVTQLQPPLRGVSLEFKGATVLFTSTGEPAALEQIAKHAKEHRLPLVAGTQNTPVSSVAKGYSTLSSVVPKPTVFSLQHQILPSFLTSSNVLYNEKRIEPEPSMPTFNQLLAAEVVL
ncbi:hypothetical protein DIPPA_01779 [Diplonema papillatum]|nr:hypothetical protein DIPPA_01779 [Diplonema papillatum]